MASKFRIQNAELRGSSETTVVVRTRAGSVMGVKLDGGDKGAFGTGPVRMTVDATGCKVTVCTLPKETFSYGSVYTELTFHGTIDVSVDEDFLVVECAGAVSFLSGPLPVDASAIDGAGTVELYSSEADPQPHKP